MLQSGGSVVVRRTDPVGRLSAFLERISERHEPVELVAQHYNFLPQRFRYRGQIWRVRQIMQVWDRSTTLLASPRRYFRVICQDGIPRVLFQDLRLGTWHLSR